MKLSALLPVIFIPFIPVVFCFPSTDTTNHHHHEPPSHSKHSMPSHVPSHHAKSYETPVFSYDKLYNLTTRFFDAFLYPANVAQTNSINSTLFADNILGRVDISRTFNGRELNTEYVFGLFSNLHTTPHFFTLLGLPLAYNFTHFVGTQNIVSVAAIIDFQFPALGIVAPIELDLWMTYNADGQISQYDATFRWFDWQLFSFLGIGQKRLGLNSTAAVVSTVTSLIATSVCETAQTYCNGTAVQYDSFSDCYSFLTQDVRFGAGYEIGMNTLLCRMLHQVMVPFRPDVHCPHIGPSGGAYCVDDLVYADVVHQSIYANSPFVAWGLQNENETIAEM